MLVLLAWLCLRRRREWRECREHVEGAGDGAPVRCWCGVAMISGRAGLEAVMLWLAVLGLVAVMLWLAVLWWLTVPVAGRVGAVAARGDL